MISSMACCRATCAMIPAAPDNRAGLLSSVPGPRTNSTNPLIWPLSPFRTPVASPDFELVRSPYFWMASADCLVSFTQRPELAASSEAICAASEAASRAGPSRCSPRSLDGRLSETRKRSTAVGSPMTAKPSSSRIS